MKFMAATHGVFYPPSAMIEGLWVAVQEEIRSRAHGEVDAEGLALIDKLKSLTFPQEVALLESLEQRRRAIGPHLKVTRSPRGSLERARHHHRAQRA